MHKNRAYELDNLILIHRENDIYFLEIQINEQHQIFKFSTVLELLDIICEFLTPEINKELNGFREILDNLISDKKEKEKELATTSDNKERLQKRITEINRDIEYTQGKINILHMLLDNLTNLRLIIKQYFE